MFKKNKRITKNLSTDFELNLKENIIPWQTYPRPQLKRDSYICLNGQWDFEVCNNGGITYKGKITVPFVPESRISGVNTEIKKDDILVYKKDFVLPQDFMRDRVILNFGAVDQYCKVFVNGEFVGENKGGYLPFSFDITEFLNGETNELKVEAKDPLDKELPYGKQTENPSGMWYTKISGIWQTVWLESVPENYIKNIKITPSSDSVKISVSASGEKQITVFIESGNIVKNFNSKEIEIKIDNPVSWTPENPYLYNFTVTAGEDRVESYFALRTVEIKEFEDRKYICLNGSPYFFNGLLDQGYFSDGIFLPATDEGYKNDILRMKELGFNTLRKHIKTEPDLFYYYCDKYGMIVFQDFINSGKYSFFIDTALPTVFMKKGITHKASLLRRADFIKTGVGIIASLYNHPSVCYYTIFNEGWGQFCADEMYNYFKPLDKTRIFDTTSGWFKTKLSDVESEHVYFRKIKLMPKKRPLILSEFGGYSYKVKDHIFNICGNYGYGVFKTREEFENAFVKLYEEQIIPAVKNGLNGAVYTQVSDVEDETNGILTYDRKVLKLNPETTTELFRKLYNEFYGLQALQGE